MDAAETAADAGASPDVRPRGVAAAGEAAITARALAKRYPRGLLRRPRAVLQAVDLDLPRGETAALVGPNGSGKSTLLRLLAGLERPDSGLLEVLGGPADARQVRARVGYLGDADDWPEELRAGEALELLGSLAGWRGADLHDRIAAALARVDLADEQRTRISRFSLGMRRRFGLAAATLTDPELLLFDEPSAGLDAPGQRVLAQILADARERGRTVLVATHQLDDLSTFADRLLLLVSGRLAACGTPLELVARTRSGRLELDGVDAEGLEALADAARSAGLRVEGAGPGSAALERLYRGAREDERAR